MTKKILKVLKNLFSKKRKNPNKTPKPRVSPKEVLSGYSVLKGVDDSAFLHPDSARMIDRDLLILIIKNGFIINPALIITFFKDNYNLSMDEFAILMFDLAMKCSRYVDSETLILEDALKLNDGTFSEKSRNYFSLLLDEQIAVSEERTRNEYYEYKDKLEEDKRVRKTLGWKNAEADRLIDEYLAAKVKEN